MKRVGVGLVVALACSTFQGVGAETAKQPITFEEMLNAESFGDAEFSPDGKWLAFTREMPPTQQPSWGYVDGRRVRTRLFVARSDGEELREIANTPDVRYAPVPGHLWSPDGRGLALLASARDGYGLAYYDLATGHVTAIPGRPVYATMAWLPDGRIVYPQIADSERQRDLSATLLDSLEHHWRAGWTTDTPQVTVSSSSSVFADRPHAEGALVLFDQRDGSRAVLAKGNFTEIKASPDGRHVAAIAMGENLPDANSGRGRRGELEIFELDNSRSRTLLRDQSVDMSLYSSMSWSPSGDRFIFVGRPLRDGEGRIVDYGRNLNAGMQLYEFDVRSHKVRRLSKEGLSHGNPDLNDLGVLPIGWMGERPVGIATHHVEGATGSGVPTHATLEYGFTRDTRFDLFAFGGREPENLSAFAKTSVERFAVPKGADYAYVVADGALWKVAPGKPAQRVSPGGAPQILDFGLDRAFPTPAADTAYYRDGSDERISLTVRSGNAPGRVVLELPSGKLVPQPSPADIVATAPDQMRTLTKAADGWATSLDLSDGASKTLVTINGALKDRAVAPAEAFTYQYNGKSLTGWVLLPPGSEPGKKLPAIVSIYGGAVYSASQPPSAARTDFPLPVLSGQSLAQEGYAVIFPSTPLGAGADTDLMATLAAETIAAIDALAAKGTIDPARVGIIGQSFGGFSTAAILSERSDRFRAGVAMAGVYDWMHGYGLRSTEAMFNDDDNMDAQETLLIESGQSRLEKPFWRATDAYMRNSPIFRADKLDAPLLLLHGDLDLAVTGLTGAERMYNALVRAGKHPTLVHYWGEGHVAESDWAIRDQWMRITRWFAYYLKNERPAEH